MKCMYCKKEMQDIGDSYLCTGTPGNWHYHRSVKEYKTGWSIEDGSKSFQSFVRRTMEKC